MVCAFPTLAGSSAGEGITSPKRVEAARKTPSSNKCGHHTHSDHISTTRMLPARAKAKPPKPRPPPLHSRHSSSGSNAEGTKRRYLHLHERRAAGPAAKPTIPLQTSSTCTKHQRLASSPTELPPTPQGTCDFPFFLHPHQKKEGFQNIACGVPPATKKDIRSRSCMMLLPL